MRIRKKINVGKYGFEMLIDTSYGGNYFVWGWGTNKWVQPLVHIVAEKQKGKKGYTYVKAFKNLPRFFKDANNPMYP